MPAGRVVLTICMCMHCIIALIRLERNEAGTLNNIFRPLVVTCVCHQYMSIGRSFRCLQTCGTSLTLGLRVMLTVFDTPLGKAVRLQVPPLSELVAP